MREAPANRIEWPKNARQGAMRAITSDRLSPY
jgi:hypothetical protein